jgi:hypothetical protein
MLKELTFDPKIKQNKTKKKKKKKKKKKLYKYIFTFVNTGKRRLYKSIHYK